MSDVTNGLDRARQIQRVLLDIYDRPYLIRVRFDEHAVVWNVYRMIDDGVGMRPVEVGGMAMTYRDLNSANLPFSFFQAGIESMRGQIDAYERKQGYPADDGEGEGR